MGPPLSFETHCCAMLLRLRADRTRGLLLAERRLRDAFESLTARGVAAMLSNSDHEYVRGLYGGLGYRVRTVTMSRAINSRGSARSPIPELLIDNFERVGLRSPEGLAGRP